MQELTLEASLSNVPIVTRFVDDYLAVRNCPVKVRTQLDIAIDELFSNIANYAYFPSAGQATVRISVDGDPPAVTITLIDRGVPYNPLSRQDPNVTLAAEERQIGGLGIFMTKKMMDDMTYERRDGQNILAIRKAL